MYTAAEIKEEFLNHGGELKVSSKEVPGALRILLEYGLQRDREARKKISMTQVMEINKQFILVY